MEGQQGVVEVFLGIGAGVAIGEDEFAISVGEYDGGLFVEPEHTHAFFVVGVGVGDGEQSLCQVVFGCFCGQRLGFAGGLEGHRNVGIQFAGDAGLKAGYGGRYKGLWQELKVAVDIHPGDVVFEGSGVFDDLVRQRLALGVEGEVMHDIIVVNSQNLMGVATVLGWMMPEGIHGSKGN